MKKRLNTYKIGVIAQTIIISTLFSLELFWGASVQQDLFRGLYCLFFLTLFAYIMFDLYLKDSRNTKLRTTGPFAFSRHPVYMCLFMISLSYWFSENDGLMQVIILQSVLWTALVTASLMQEKIILQKYGKAAEEYYRKTPRFIFF